jgi:hypothetical protein
VRIECFDGYARSATWGTQDLFANPTIMVPPAAPPPIEIAATRGGAEFTANLKVRESNSAKTPFVVLVPQFPSSGPVAVFGREENGEWQFEGTGLAPGSYLAYAFSSRHDVEYRNPAFLKSLQGGVTVQIADQGAATVVLQEFVR